MVFEQVLSSILELRINSLCPDTVGDVIVFFVNALTEEWSIEYNTIGYISDYKNKEYLLTVKMFYKEVFSIIFNHSFRKLAMVAMIAIPLSPALSIVGIPLLGLGICIKLDMF